MMLKALLELAAQGSVHTHTELARELGVGEELLEQTIKDLALRALVTS